MTQEKPQGPVLVIGGGVAGIQAALDLSAAGYGTYLVERSASLGGMIPRLHRLFPLCSCCKLDLRIASCEQDPNIRVMLNTTIKALSGKSGDFQIVLEDDGKETEVSVGAIILAAGLEPFDPTRFDTYAYGRLPNVVTSVEFEAMQKPTGPQQGLVLRPSDNKPPEKIAWLQCVGSRDINRCDVPYCSSVCCMYALKEAVNSMEMNVSTETTIFFMDMRTHGKGWERYFNEAVDRGVRLIRSRVHSVTPVADSDDLLIAYADESGEPRTEIFDLLVLSVGIRPSSTAISLGRDLGLEFTTDKYLASKPFASTATNVPGVFVCGGINGPIDISQSLMQASSAVSEVTAFLEPTSFEAQASYREPSHTPSDPPRMFIAYHLCPGMDENIGQIIQDYSPQLPDVAAVSQMSGDLLVNLVEGLKSSQGNRVVFASCTPVTYKDLVEEALRLAGLNPFLYEMVDLRNINVTPPSSQLQDRIRMGVARAAFITPPEIKSIPVEKRALIVGGGLAGLESALAVAGCGFPVTLVEKQDKPGGNASHVSRTWQGSDVREHLKAVVSRVEENENIEVLVNTTVKESKGFAGNFLTTLDQKGKDIDVAHGVTILAPGGKASAPVEYAYGENSNIYTWDELGRKLIDDSESLYNAKCAVFIQCVGSREPEHPYCSNFCCTFAVRTATDLKSKNPDMDIFILYREMCTFGERESLYREAREKGVIFVRFDLDHKPLVKAKKGDGSLLVTVYDFILQKHIAIEADFISLQSAIVPDANQEIAEKFHIELDPDGFLAESPEKLRPMETSRPGIYFAGLAHYPKDTWESITQAKGAAARALEILKKDAVQTGGLVAAVRTEKCAVCCTCVRTCPFHIPIIDHELGAAFIDPGLCRGCGMCVAECPAKAIIMTSCSDEMLNQAPLVLIGG
jgi:heterodisulfide reductase subunit A